MRDFVKWASGSATKRNSTVGPRHDPYSRDTVAVTIHGKTTTFVSCGLAGEYFLDPDGHMIRADLRTKEEYNECCVHFTGQTHDFWMDRLWIKLDNARYRCDPEAWELQQQMDICDGYYGHP